jgi:hypothetical protein
VANREHRSDVAPSLIFCKIGADLDATSALATWQAESKGAR